jgi:uncharacterized protein YaeQ
MHVYALHDSTSIWWENLKNRVHRIENLTIDHIPEDSGAELASFSERTMDMQVSIQEGEIWLTAGARSSQIQIVRLYP